MSSINSDIFDLTLSELAESDELHLCSQEPTTYAEVATYSLGVKTNPSFGYPEDSATGRQLRMLAISNGQSNTNGTATHYALVNAANSKLNQTGNIPQPFSVNAGNSFSVPELVILKINNPQ